MPTERNDSLRELDSTDAMGGSDLDQTAKSQTPWDWLISGLVLTSKHGKAGERCLAKTLIGPSAGLVL